MTSLHLRKCFGDTIKIGGPAFCWWGAWGDKFIPFCAKEKLPLDFYSWHCYYRNARSVGDAARQARALLDKHGFTKTENHCNEWNYVKGWTDEWTYSLECERGMYAHKGAASIAAVMIDCQDAPMDMLMFYDARITSGMNNMFNAQSLRPMKGYFPFLAWSRLRDLGTQIETKILNPGPKKDLYACAAKNAAGKMALFVARYTDDNNRTATYKLKVSFPEGVKTDWSKVRCVITDATFTNTELPMILNKDGTASLKMQPNSFALIEF